MIHLGDLRYLLENYRTGGFVPKIQAYENYYGSVEGTVVLCRLGMTLLIAPEKSRTTALMALRRSSSHCSMYLCELDRLKAIKAVVLDFSGAISNVIPNLQSTVDHSSSRMPGSWVRIHQYGSSPADISSHRGAELFPDITFANFNFHQNKTSVSISKLEPVPTANVFRSW
jgi:hypothetical protein